MHANLKGKLWYLLDQVLSNEKSIQLFDIKKQNIVYLDTEEVQMCEKFNELGILIICIYMLPCNILYWQRA